MYHVYVMKSERNGKRYVGSTKKIPNQRVVEHNTGNTTFTRNNRLWHLIHSEAFPTKNETLRREKFLKSGQGRKWLDENVPG